MAEKTGLPATPAADPAAVPANDPAPAPPTPMPVALPLGQTPSPDAPQPAFIGYFYPTGAGYAPPPLPPPPPFAPYAAPPKSPVEVAAIQHNQHLLVLGIIAALSLVHLPWLAYLWAMHGCWGNFVDLCFGSPVSDLDEVSETPFLFARIAFFILRLQTTLAVDFQQFSQVMQIGTGLGSFALTKIVAANGTVVQGRLQRYGLAATCAVAFVVLFWAELTLTSAANYPVLGDETVLGYIDSELPADFVGASEAKAGLMQYLQFLRLADALIFGAALAMPKSPRPQTPVQDSK